MGVTDNVVKEKSFAFAIRIVTLYKYLVNEKVETTITFRHSHWGIEAEQAESKADFVHKLAIALKEANETDYWLLLLHETNYLPDTEKESMTTDNTELLKLLISIINMTKKQYGHSPI